MAYTPAPAMYAYMMAPEYTPYTYGYEYPPGAFAALDPSMTKRGSDGDAAMSGTKRAPPPNYHMRKMHDERQERLAAFNLQALADALPVDVAEPSLMLPTLKEVEEERRQRREAAAAPLVAEPSPMQALLKEMALERQWRRKRKQELKERKRQGGDRMDETDVKRRAPRGQSESSMWVSASDFVRVR